MQDFQEDVRELKQDVKEIKAVMVENTIKLAEYNADLKIHIQASNDLHNRMVPIEEHAIFMRKMAKFITWMIGLTAGIGTILRVWHR